MNKIKFTFNLFFAFLISLTVNAQQWNGLTYYGNMSSSMGYLVDTNGTTIKTFTYTGSGNNGYSTHMMPGGDIWRSVSNTGNLLVGGGITGRIQKWIFNNCFVLDYVF